MKVMSTYSEPEPNEEYEWVKVPIICNYTQNAKQINPMRHFTYYMKLKKKKSYR